MTLRDRLLMRDDPDVAFGLAILRAPIVNLRWTVESRDPVIKAFIENALRPIYRQFAKAASLAIGLGFQVVEKVWEAKPLNVDVDDPVTGKITKQSFPMAWTISKTKAIDPRTLSLEADPATDEWIGVRQHTVISKRSSQQQGPQLVGRDRCVLWSFRDEDVFGRLHGYPILDQAYIPWYAKAGLSMYRNRYFERRADPTGKLRVSASGLKNASNKTIDGFKFGEEMLAAKKAGADLLIPSLRDDKGNFLFDYEYLTDDKRGDMYDQAIESCSRQILRGLWLTDRAGTSGGAGGIGTGEAQAHVETLAGTLEMIVDEFLDEVLNPQLIDALVLYNFGEQALQESQTRVVGSGVSSEMRELLKQVLLALMSAEQFGADGKLIPIWKQLNSAAIARKLDLPMRSAEEIEELTPPEDPAAPGAGGSSDTDPGDDEEVDEETERAAGDRLTKRGVVDKESLEALPGREGEIADKVLAEVERRSARARRPEQLAGAGAAADGLHIHLPESLKLEPLKLEALNPPPATIVVNVPPPPPAQIVIQPTPAAQVSFSPEIHVAPSPAPNVTVELKPTAKTVTFSKDGKTAEITPKEVS